MPIVGVFFRGALHGQALVFDAVANAWRGRVLTGTTGSDDLLSAVAPNGEASTIARCTAVSIVASGFVKRAHRPSQALSRVLGLVSVGAAPTLALTIQICGRFEATTPEWDSVTGQTGGLTPGARYYLGSSGLITTTPPSTPGDSVVLLGIALTATELDLRPTDPVLL